PCGSALSSWVLSCLGISRSRSGVSILTARFGTFTTSPSLTCFLGSTPSPNIRQTYFVLVSPIISQGNSRLPAQRSTQIFAFNATAPTLFFAPFRGTIENEYEKTNSLSHCDIRLTSSCHLWRRTGRIFDASYSAA